MRSELPMTDWQGDITVFPGQFQTIPMHIKKGVRATELADILCTKMPYVAFDKAKAPYALPCKLHNAPLVGKTLLRAKERGLPLIGQMRSANHVTEGRWIKLDLDGIGRDETRTLLDKLDSERIGHLLYSTYSHGFKPRNRLRLILLLDRAVTPTDYKRASQGAALWLLGQSLDLSEGNLHQLAGVYMCHPERQNKAFRLIDIGVDRYCISADALLALVPERIKPALNRLATIPVNGKSKIWDAITWIDANDTSTWICVGMALKTLEPELGANALANWLAFSNSADDAAKAHNDSDERYNPETMWESFAPTMTSDAGIGQIMALARDGAAQAVMKAIQSGELDQRRRDAVVYLEQRHPRLLNSLLTDAGIVGEV